MTHTRFLVRPRPLPGESLSSWRQRSAWENGFRLFPLQDERSRRVDPDIGLSQTDLHWIAETHSLDPADVMALTLGFHVGTIVDVLFTRSQPRWWLRARYGHNARPYGPMYCPKCLHDDATPYFRLAWRLGFFTHCPLHHCELLDQCPVCLRAPWPSGCAVHDRISEKFFSFRQCWHCGADLDLVPAKHGEATSSIQLERWVQDGYALLGGDRVPAIEALGALRAICHLFVRNRSRITILGSSSSWAAIAEAIGEAGDKSVAVEHLGVSHRAILIPAAMRILSGWPQSFVSFAAEARVSRAHFSGADHLQPKWMSELIDGKLAKQNRWVTPLRVAEVVSHLRAELKEMPTKTLVRQHLNWQGVGTLGDYYVKRTVATTIEWEKFCAATASIDDHRGVRRWHSASTLDLAVVMVSLIQSRPIGDIVNLNLTELLGALKAASSEPASAKLPGLCRVVASRLEGIVHASSYLRPDSKASVRQVAERVRFWMAGLNEDLLRDVAVFRDAALKM